jgi:hypothetical protein
MRFVDGEENRPQLHEEPAEVGVLQALRRHEEELDGAGSELALDEIAVVLGLRAVQAGSGNSPTAKGVDLILHQRDEGRDDESHPIEDERRKLVAKTLAGAGRHHRQYRPTGQHAADDLELARSKVGVAEVLLKQRVKLTHRARLEMAFQRPPPGIAEA